jgi:hypothetical protein
MKLVARRRRARGRFLRTEHLSPEPAEAPHQDHARLPRLARHDADLRRVRHVDRNGARQRVGQEIGNGVAELAEEFALTVAELSYLPERRRPTRTLPPHQPSRRESVAMALTQAEKYGTPLGQALRVMAKENREMRISEAEKKAAALPPN